MSTEQPPAVLAEQAAIAEPRRTMIVSGSGRYRDPWHPFARTSALLAELLTSQGFMTTVEDDLDEAMTRLNGVSLLVVNAGDPWRNAAPSSAPHVPGPQFAAPPEAIEGFRQALQRGVGILAMHTAPATMRDYPDWAPTVGAIWLPGLSTHPPADEVTITVCDSRLAANDTIRVFDERYCRLQQVGQSETVATHTVDGTTHPTAWLRKVGRSRIAVDLLGHDERSYESEGHRALIISLARWTTSGPGT